MDLRWSRWRPNGAHQRARRTRRASRFHSQPLLRSDRRVLLRHRQFQALDWTSLPSGGHGLRLGAEHGFALGGGRMASLFAEALFAEGGSTTALAGLRVYFGQHDKTLIDRHRQDDPLNLFDLVSGLQIEHLDPYQRQMVYDIVNSLLEQQNRILQSLTR